MFGAGGSGVGKGDAGGNAGGHDGLAVEDVLEAGVAVGEQPFLGQAHDHFAQGLVVRLGAEVKDDVPRADDASEVEGRLERLGVGGDLDDLAEARGVDVALHLLDAAVDLDERLVHDGADEESLIGAGLEVEAVAVELE